MIDRTVKHLAFGNTKTTQRFDELMDQIDHGSFAVREKATKTLRQDIDEFLPLLVKAESAGDLPLEVKSRMTKVMTRYTRETRGTDSMVSAMGLASSVDYLIAALPHVSDGNQQKIATKLNRLTGEDHGVDVEGWKNWQLAK